MKNSIIIPAIVFVAVLLLFIGLNTKTGEESEVQKNEDTQEVRAEKAQSVTVSPLEHATTVLTLASTTIYVDPVGGGDSFKEYSAPELIVITDIHGDHLNVRTLEQVSTDNTVIVAPQAVADMLPQVLSAKTVVLANGEKTEQKGVSIEAIPMYNLPEQDDEAHTKGRGNGYVLEKEGTRVYVAGDTDGTEEMRALTDIDVALVPMNPPYTMSVEEAVEAVVAFAPSQVYPYHYRGANGLSDIEKFKQLVEEKNTSIEVVLLNWYPQTAAQNTIETVQTTAEQVENVEEDAPTVSLEPATYRIEISGTNYAFDVEEIKVKKGDTVNIVFKNNEGFHDWVIDEFDAQTKQITQGQTTEVSFVADTTGTFEYYCSVGNHRAQGMVGTLIVE